MSSQSTLALEDQKHSSCQLLYALCRICTLTTACPKTCASSADARRSLRRKGHSFPTSKNTSPRARSRQEASFITPRETAAGCELCKASSISRNNYSEEDTHSSSDSVKDVSQSNNNVYSITISALKPLKIWRFKTFGIKRVYIGNTIIKEII